MKYVRDILQKKGNSVACVSPGSTVLDAAQLMNDHRIGAVVVQNNDRVAGIFTERDILMRVVAQRKDPSTVLVSDVMTTPCLICHPEDLIDQCQFMMTDRRIRHLPVVDAGTLVGIVSSGDILASRNLELENTVNYLNEYIYG